MRNRLIQLIHVAKRELNLDDDIYRSVLKDIAGKSSCAKMNIKELESIIEHFKRVGFKVKKKAVNNKRIAPKLSRSVSSESAKIRAIWITMHQQGFVRDSSEQALDNYISRMLNRKTLGENISFHCQFLNGQQAYKILEIIKNWHKRELVKWLDEKWQSLRLVKRFESLNHCIAVLSGKTANTESYHNICFIYAEATGASKEL
jgi:phage gp16-like protein